MTHQELNDVKLIQLQHDTPGAQQCQAHRVPNMYFVALHWELDKY